MTTERDQIESWYAEKSMRWYGWGSPVGLGLFIVAVGAFVLLLSHAGIWR